MSLWLVAVALEMGPERETVDDEFFTVSTYLKKWFCHGPAMAFIQVADDCLLSDTDRHH